MLSRHLAWYRIGLAGYRLSTSTFLGLASSARRFWFHWAEKSLKCSLCSVCVYVMGSPVLRSFFTFPPHFLGGCRPCFLFFSLVCCVHNFWGFILYTFRYFTFCPFDGKFYSFSFLFFFFLRSRGCDEVRKFAKAHFIGVIAGRTIVFTAPVSCLSHRTRLELL